MNDKGKQLTFVKCKRLDGKSRDILTRKKVKLLNASDDFVSGSKIHIKEGWLSYIYVKKKIIDIIIVKEFDVIEVGSGKIIQTKEYNNGQIKSKKELNSFELKKQEQKASGYTKEYEEKTNMNDTPSFMHDVYSPF